MIGITSYGAYIPRLRLDRMAIFQSMGWFAPAIMMVAQGERSMCNWDEDALTMSVSATQDCLKGMDKNKLDAVYLASTTLPFADRQNAGVLKTALNLRDDIVATDITGSQKAGTTALITALDVVAGGAKKNIMVTGTDKRETKGAYFYEMWFGDGAASVAVGDTDVIAEFMGSYSASHDFNDHYRGAANRVDYVWEERWARDVGYSQFIPEAINGAMKNAGIAIGDVSKIMFPCFFKAEHRKIAKKLGATPEQVIDNLHEVCGECGVAHPFIMLASALDDAKAGDILVVAGYGHGCDALVFKVTENIDKQVDRDGFAGTIANRKLVDNYSKFLVFRGLVENEMGIRAEAQTQTAMTVLWRKRKMLLGLVGGKCTKCGTPQFPKMDICVNPSCGAIHTQEDYEFSSITAKIRTFTADMLTVSYEPPHKYGLVQFEGGGRFMADFTDCDQEDLRVGLPMKMAFRLRVWDKARGMRNYFWKAAPVPGAAAEMDKINYNDRVAVVTGAGGGLGRTYALELAARGCKVVVNDLGGSRDGTGASSSAADTVVEEIKAAGGEAVANYDNVATPEGGEGIIKSAIDAFGRIDIVVNNAGILRDKSFVKMEPDNWNAVVAVHLSGAYNVTKPAFKLMKAQGFGRIIMTTSAAGLYGNFGQTNYSSAKMALVGLMNTLKIEGAKYNIKINTIAPLAASRLTEDIMPPEMFAKMKPEFVSPMVLYLASEECQESGQIFNVGMGYFNRAAVFTGPTTQLGDADNPPTVEDIADNWEAINNLEGAKELNDLTSAMMDMLTPPAPASKAAAAPAAGAALTPADIFKAMPDGFLADKAEGVDVVFQYDISGPNGGQWNVTIKDKTCTVAEGTADSPTTTISMNDDDMVAMLTGELNPMKAFNSGKLKIGGDVMKSQLIEKLFTTK